MKNIIMDGAFKIAALHDAVNHYVSERVETSNLSLQF